jgi:carotenoid cleavage dioxygenase-like enzyme
MEIQFPDIPLYKGWGHPYRVEATVRGLELMEGHLPPEIEGTLLRCGPDRQYPPRNGSDVFIDGEGMVHTFRFSGGQVDYMSRWVRTERFVLQEEARRALLGRYRNRFTNAPEAGGARMGTANTNRCFMRASYSLSKRTTCRTSSIRRRWKRGDTTTSPEQSPA